MNKRDQWPGLRPGYREPNARPVAGTATVITPPAIMGVLATGYPVQIDAAATELVR